MATSASIRMPWRILNRSVVLKPLAPASSRLVSHNFRTRQCVQQPVIARRHASDLVKPPSESEPPAPPPQPIAQETDQEITAEESGREGNFRSTVASGTSDLELSSPDTSNEPPRLPRAVQAVYLRPLRRQAEYGVPTCDLQLRSYNVRNLEFFADFCLRAAYYLGLPASGPVPLPRIVERWTVPRSSFIFKKSQENFERRTVRRLIQIKDGNPETVEIWLAFIRKHAYYGIGMKANVYEFEGLGVGKTMDMEMEQLKDTVNKTFDQVGVSKGNKLNAEQIMELVNRENFRAATHGNAPFVKVPPPV